MMDNDSPEAYQNHWGSSLETNENPEGGDDDEEEEIPFVDDLPLFANTSSKALHDETKVLETKRDLAEKVRILDPLCWFCSSFLLTSHPSAPSHPRRRLQRTRSAFRS